MDRARGLPGWALYTNFVGNYLPSPLEGAICLNRRETFKSKKEPKNHTFPSDICFTFEYGRDPILCNLVLTRATNSSTRVFVSLNIESRLRVELTFFLACSCSSKRDGQLATISSNLNNVAYMFCSNNRSPLFTEHN